MTVGELIIELQRLPEDLEVVMAKDEEENAYGAIASVEEDEGGCVVMLPGYQGELHEVVDGYEYINEDED